MFTQNQLRKRFSKKITGLKNKNWWFKKCFRAADDLTPAAPESAVVFEPVQVDAPLPEDFGEESCNSLVPAFEQGHSSISELGSIDDDESSETDDIQVQAPEASDSFGSTQSYDKEVPFVAEEPQDVLVEQPHRSLRPSIDQGHASVSDLDWNHDDESSDGIETDSVMKCVDGTTTGPQTAINRQVTYVVGGSNAIEDSDLCRSFVVPERVFRGKNRSSLNLAKDHDDDVLPTAEYPKRKVTWKVHLEEVGSFENNSPSISFVEDEQTQEGSVADIDLTGSISEEEPEDVNARNLEGDSPVVTRISAIEIQQPCGNTHEFGNDGVSAASEPVVIPSFAGQPAIEEFEEEESSVDLEEEEVARRRSDDARPRWCLVVDDFARNSSEEESEVLDEVNLRDDSPISTSTSATEIQQPLENSCVFGTDGDSERSAHAGLSGLTSQHSIEEFEEEKSSVDLEEEVAIRRSAYAGPLWYLSGDDFALSSSEEEELEDVDQIRSVTEPRRESAEILLGDLSDRTVTDASRTGGSGGCGRSSIFSILDEQPREPFMDTISMEEERGESSESGSSRNLSQEEVPLLSAEDWELLNEGPSALRKVRRAAKKKSKSLAHSMWSALPGQGGKKKKEAKKDDDNGGEILSEFPTTPQSE